MPLCGESAISVAVLKERYLICREKNEFVLYGTISQITANGFLFYLPYAVSRKIPVPSSASTDGGTHEIRPEPSFCYHLGPK